MFKSKIYPNNRKVAEAVNRCLSNSVDPLFYLSSFQNPFADTPVPGHSHRGLFRHQAATDNTSLYCCYVSTPLGSFNSIGPQEMWNHGRDIS